MTIRFEPAVRQRVPLLVGLTGGAGAGKTYSACRIAAGISGDKPFVVIDTDNRRASHYAEYFRFDVFNMDPPFAPPRFVEVAQAAVAAGYPAIVIDSFSHEWMGEGGVLSMHAAELDRMTGGDWRRAEKMKMVAWIKPKQAHGAMLEALRRIMVPIILCMRGKPSMRMVKNGNKTEVTEGPIRPIGEQDADFELTALLVLTAEHPGCVDLEQPNKLSRPIRPLIQDKQPLDEDFGRRLAAWAAGEASKSEAGRPQAPAKAEKPRANTTGSQPQQSALAKVKFGVTGGDGKVRQTSDIDEWTKAWTKMLAKAQAENALDAVRALRESNREHFDAARKNHPEQVAEVEGLMRRVLGEAEPEGERRNEAQGEAPPAGQGDLLQAGAAA